MTQDTETLFPLPALQADIENVKESLLGLPVIGIHAGALSGKSEVGRFMRGKGMFTIAFMDRAKAAAQQVFGLTDEETWNDAYKEVVIPRLNMTPREIYQRFLTDVCREHVDDDLWIRNALRDIGNTMEAPAAASDDNWVQPYTGVVISDVRTSHEANVVRDIGGTIVHLDRDNKCAERVAGKHRATDRTHSTEQNLAWQSGDYHVVNNGTLDELYQNCAEVLYSEMERRELEFAETAVHAEHSGSHLMVM